MEKLDRKIALQMAQHELKSLDRYLKDIDNVDVGLARISAHGLLSLLDWLYWDNLHDRI